MKPKIMNPKDKYCEDCGHKTIVKLTDEYDTATGKQIAYMYCGNRACIWGESTCDNGGTHVYESEGLLKGMFSNIEKRCGICGHSVRKTFDMIY